MWYVIQTVTGKEQELMKAIENVLVGNEKEKKHIKDVLPWNGNASGESKDSFGFILNRYFRLMCLQRPIIRMHFLLP